MSSFKADLKIDNELYRILHCSYEITQETDAEGKPASVVRGGIINLDIESSGDTKIAETMVDSTKRISGSIIFYKDDSNATMKELKFEEAYVVGYKESFNSTGDGPMTEHFKLSAWKITIGEMEFKKDWIES